MSYDFAKWFLACMLILLCTLGNSSGTKKVLVLGGTGFLGGETLHNLLQRDIEIHLLTRGNLYFDSDTRLAWLAHRHFLCDRDELLRKTCKELLTSGYYDYVIDFSSFKQVQMDQMLDVLRNRVGVYVYISTDSIYEVTSKDHFSLTKETDDERPKNATLADLMNKDNKYGDNKLKCEESLKKQRRMGGFPFVILRVADAIGPRDSTARFWIYHLWIALHKKLGIRVSLPSAIQDYEFSLAYSRDVSRAIEYVVDGDDGAFDQAINIAFEEPVTLRGLLTAIGGCHGISSIEYDHNIETAWYRFPTTTRGPLDVTSAGRLLTYWTPTKFEDAIKETCDYFSGAIVDSVLKREREIMLATFIDDVLPPEADDEDAFTEALQDMYGPSVLEGIDLGFDVDPHQPRIPQTTSSEDDHDMKEEL